VNAVLHIAVERQPMFGIGGTITYNGDLLVDFPERETVYRALFSDLKLDFLRLRNYHDYPGQEANFAKRTRDFARAARRWSEPKKRDGKGPVRLMFTSWSPPARLKSNNLVSGRADGTEKGAESVTLKRDANGNYMYREFADWWLDSLQKFKELVGVYPDYIALQNELDISVSYEGCRFLPSEGIGVEGFPYAGYDRALIAVSDRLNSALGKDAPRIIGPETFTIRTEKDTNHLTKFIDPTTETGKSILSRLYGVSFHIYGSGAEAPETSTFHTALNTVRDAYRSNGVDKPLFQTEFLEGDTMMALAGMIHDTFTYGDASAYFVWILARSVNQPGYAMVYYNPYDGSVERRERFYAVKHFSAFVGEGYHRIETECADASVKLSAYISADKKRLVTVAINPTGQEKRVQLTPDGTAFASATTAIYRSTQGESGERWRAVGPLPTDRTVVLPPRSIATVTFDAKASR
jgi:O-glycosyl hydrolase